MSRFRTHGSLPLVLLLLILPAAAFPAAAATFPSARPHSTNNDDTCDVAVMPAATLLIPYFEVQLDTSIIRAKTTLFTVVNTVPEPQITRVTIWTDWGYPVLSYNLLLTGYDVESINLFDVLARGILMQEWSTAKEPGARSLPNHANPHFGPDAAQSCPYAALRLPEALLSDVRGALTTGMISTCGPKRVGGTHRNATGYVTIDVVSTCSTRSPAEAAYYDEILFDNVLTGDYQHLSPDPNTGNYAGGAAMVHLRAVPEGGPAGAEVATPLPYTFYDLYTPDSARRKDRRQPLPSTFATRYVEGGPGEFKTEVQFWREPASGRGDACGLAGNGAMEVTEIIRFDERENPTAVSNGRATVGSAARIPTTSDIFPPTVPGEVAGWIYVNANNGGSMSYSTAPNRDFTSNSSTRVGRRQSQNWLSLSMYAESRYSALFDATQLANGCSIAPAKSGSRASAAIGPGGNETP